MYQKRAIVSIGMLFASRQKKMTNIKNQFDRLGLSDIDFDLNEKIESKEDIVNYISTSGRLFRKTLEYMVLKDIQLYFNNSTIEPNSNLKDYFSRKGIRFEWVKFTNYFGLINLMVPSLKATRITIGILIIYAIWFLYFTYWLVFIQFNLVMHIILSKVALIPILLAIGWYLGIGIYLIGKLKLPTKTFGQLIDKIINKNISRLLAEDKKQFKEMVLKELVD